MMYVTLMDPRPQHLHPASGAQDPSRISAAGERSFVDGEAAAPDTCPFEARQKICRKITNSKPGQDHRHGSVRTQASARLVNRARRTGRKSFSSPTSRPFYHGGFFADLATRLRELAKACRAQVLSSRLGRSSDISRRTGSWPSKSRPGSIRPKPCFAAACIKSGRVKFACRRSTRGRSTPARR